MLVLWVLLLQEPSLRVLFQWVILLQMLLLWVLLLQEPWLRVLFQWVILALLQMLLLYR